MKLLLPIGISLLLLAWQPARAQSADDFFNSGAHSYISNNIPAALVVVEKGLKQYPDDVKLKKLYELLKQQSKQQSKKNQSKQNQQKQSQQQKSQNDRNHQKQDQQKNQQAKNQSEQQKQQQQAQSSAQEKQNEQKGQKEPAQSARARQMSPEEAQRLLNAQKGNEQFLQMRPRGKPGNTPTEDW